MWWSRRPTLTSSVTSDVKPITYYFLHTSTKFPSFYLVFGRKPKLAIDLVVGDDEVKAVSQDYSKF